MCFVVLYGNDLICLCLNLVFCFLEKKFSKFEFEYWICLKCGEYNISGLEDGNCCIVYYMFMCLRWYLFELFIIDCLLIENLDVKFICWIWF